MRTLIAAEAPLLLAFPKGLCLALLVFAPAQDLNSLAGPPARTHQFITYATTQQTVVAHTRTVVELTFYVDPGYHVNSHTPKSELLIPTRVELQPTPGIATAIPEYPAGKPYAFAFDPSEKLDVYADSFTVKLPLTVATAGPHTLHGTLKYQACDKAACYPPKSLPIDIPITATNP